MSNLNDFLQEQYEDFRMLARRATLESLDQPNWELNTQCVNIVKSSTDPAFLYEIAQMLRRRLREPQLRVVVLTLYLIDALAHNCGHELLLAFNDELFMQQIGNVARKYYITPAEAAAGPTPELESRHEAVCVCLELLLNWATYFKPNRAIYGNIVDMYEILDCEGITSNATLSFSVDATTAPSPSLQSQSLDAAEGSKPGVAQRSYGQSSVDATTHASALTSDLSGVPRMESESLADTTVPKRKSPLPPSSEDSNADFTRIRRAESAPISNTNTNNNTDTAAAGPKGRPLQRSKSKSGDEMHPRKVAAVLQERAASADSFDEFLQTPGAGAKPKLPLPELLMMQAQALGDNEGQDVRLQSKSDGSSHSSSTRLSASEMARAASSTSASATASGTGPSVAADSKPSLGAGKLSRISENGNNESNYSLNDVLSPEEWEHHRALQSTLSNPSAKFAPPPLRKEPSPRQPAQKALDDFLQSNSAKGGILDPALQEELLNQVEIEQRIKDGAKNRDKERTSRDSAAVTPKILNASSGSQERLQLELEHQHEIERSIKEQHMHRADAFYTQDYHGSSGIAGAQPPLRSGKKGHKHSSSRSKGDSDSGEEYGGQLVDYADGTNKDFFFVAQTNSYLETDAAAAAAERRRRRELRDREREGYSYPTEKLATTPGHTRDSSNSSSIPTSASGGTTLPSRGDPSYDQQVEMQKQIFQEYERKKHRHHHSSRRHRHDQLDPQGQEQMLLEDEAREARERLLRQQESLLSASSVDSPKGYKDRSDRHRSSSHRSPKEGSGRERQGSSRAVQELTRRSTADMLVEEGGAQEPSPQKTPTSGGRHSREKDRDIPPSPKRSSRDRRPTADSPILEDTTASISAASAARREKEKREAREREIELEWEREQERAMELEKERERFLEQERQQKHSSRRSTPSGAPPRPRDDSVLTPPLTATQSHSFALEAEHSFSGAAMSGREASVQPPGAGLNLSAAAPGGEIIIVKGGSVISDLTCSTMDSGSDIEDEKTAVPPGKAEALARNPNLFEPIEPMLPLGMPVPKTTAATAAPLLVPESVKQPLPEVLAAAPPATATAAPVIAMEDPLLQSVALLLREALDPNAVAQAQAQVQAPVTPSATAGAITPGSVDRAKALAAARLLISTLLGQPTEGLEAAVVSKSAGISSQASPASERTIQAPHAYGYADVNGPTDSSYQQPQAPPLSPHRHRRSYSGVPARPDGERDSRNTTPLVGAVMADDVDGLYSNYQSANNSPIRDRPPAAEEAQGSSLPAGKGGPRMEPYRSGSYLASNLLSPSDGPPPLSPKIPGSSGRPPQHARKPSTGAESAAAATTASSQSRQRQSELVMQTLQEVSASVGMPQPPVTRNTVAMQSGISVITEDTYESSDRRRERDRERGRSKISRSSSVAALERSGREGRDGRADDRPGLSRSASVDARPRERGPKGLSIDPNAPAVEGPPASRRSTPGSRQTVGEGFPREPVSSPQQSVRKSADSGERANPLSRQAAQPSPMVRESSSGGRTRNDSFDSSHHTRSVKDFDSNRHTSQRSSRPASERISASPLRRTSSEQVMRVEEPLTPKRSSSRRSSSQQLEVHEQVDYVQEERVRSSSRRSSKEPGEEDGRERSSSRRPSLGSGTGREEVLEEGVRERTRSSRRSEPNETEPSRRSSGRRDAEHEERRSSKQLRAEQEQQELLMLQQQEEERARQERREERRRLRQLEAESLANASATSGGRGQRVQSSVEPSPRNSATSRSTPSSLGPEEQRYVEERGDRRSSRYHQEGLEQTAVTTHSAHRSSEIVSVDGRSSAFQHQQLQRDEPAVRRQPSGDQFEFSAPPGPAADPYYRDRGYERRSRGGGDEDRGDPRYAAPYTTDRGAPRQQDKPPRPAPAPQSYSAPEGSYPLPPHRKGSSERPPVPAPKPSVYQIDGLELTEEEMTFISRDLAHLPLEQQRQPPPKQVNRDYYPRDSEMRRGTSSRPKDPPPGRPGMHDDHTVQTSLSSHYHRQQGPPPPPPLPAPAPYHQLEHRSKSQGNLYAPPPAAPHQSMHRSSSQGHMPAPAPAPVPAPAGPNVSTKAGGSKGRAGWWCCSVCTLENPPSYLACDACGMVKGPTV